MPHPALRAPLAGGTGHGAAAVIEHVLEQAEIVGAELVCLLARLPLRERRGGAEPSLDILPATLDDVGHEPSPLGGTLSRSLERRVEQAQERAEALLDAAMRRGGDQDQVPPRIAGHELAQELVPQLLAAAALTTRLGGAVRLVDDDEVRRVGEEGLPLPAGLDEVDAGDERLRPS